MNDKEFALYKAYIDMAAKIDSKPKNQFFVHEKGSGYKHMCIQLAQGYEIDRIHNPYIICNEFGEEEHIDDFRRRHPNFEEDVKKLLKK